jgi:hypothetical protein
MNDFMSRNVYWDKKIIYGRVSLWRKIKMLLQLKHIEEWEALA